MRKRLNLHSIKYPEFNMPHTRSIKLTGYNTKVNTNADIAKKSVDIFSNALQVFGSNIKIIKTHTPLLALILTLLGFFISAIGALFDNNNSQLKKLATIILLIVMALASTSIFLLATTNPLVAITLSIILISTDLLLTSIKLIASCFQFVKLYFNTKEKIPTSQQNIPLLLLKDEKKKLQNQLDETIVHYNLAIQNNASKQKASPKCQQSLNLIKENIRKIQHKMLVIDKKIFKVQNKHEYLKQQLKQAKRELFEDSFDFFVTVGSNITTLLGMVLTVINPIVGISLILLGFTFDIFELTGHIVSKNHELKEVKKLKLQQVTKKSYYLIESSMRLKNKHCIKREVRSIRETKSNPTSKYSKNNNHEHSTQNHLGVNTHSFHQSANNKSKALKNKRFPQLIPQLR